LNKLIHIKLHSAAYAGGTNSNEKNSVRVFHRPDIIYLERRYTTKHGEVSCRMLPKTC